MISSFSLHPVNVHVHHCHSTFSDMDAKARPQNMILHDSEVLTKL